MTHKITFITLNPCGFTMTGGRLHTWKTIAKISQNLRNGYHLVSINPHGLMFYVLLRKFKYVCRFLLSRTHTIYHHNRLHTHRPFEHYTYISTATLSKQINTVSSNGLLACWRAKKKKSLVFSLLKLKHRRPISKHHKSKSRLTESL